jgi:hypothetical protein
LQALAAGLAEGAFEAADKGLAPMGEYGVAFLTNRAHLETHRILSGDSSLAERLPMIEVYRSSIIPAPAKRVWTLLRDFNAMPEWNTTIKSSVIEDGPADRIGCRRVLTFDDGSVWIHELTGLSDAELILSYAIVGTPQPMRIPIRDYRATLSLTTITDGDLCLVEWRATFDTDNETAVRERAGAVFQAGFDGLKRWFATHGAGGA